MANPVVFRRNIDIGAADAESDDLYLSKCFVDTGDLMALLDCENSKCIVLGRTGAGKTALLKQVARTADHVIDLHPEVLALHYVNNSSVLQFFEAAGVKLDTFYALLWRHIITVELLRSRYEITSQKKQNDFLNVIRSIIAKDKAKEKALKYLTDWGDKFWEETEYRTKEFTRKLETDLSGSAKIDAKYLSLGAEGARRLSAEEIIEVRDSATRVVNEVQVKALHDVITMLSESIFDDAQNSYYVIIDRLDEGWVEDHFRFGLIKALMETIRTFRRIRSVKIIVALRTDLHQRIIPRHGFSRISGGKISISISKPQMDANTTSDAIGRSCQIHV